MPWLLLLHISALLCWCGSILYLPALVSGSVSQLKTSTDGKQRLSCIPRDIFTLIATPAALIAIGAGTAVFLANGIVELWLLVKLAMVSVLVLGHALVGLLIVRAEQGKHQNIVRWCLTLALVLAVLMVAIIWLVLAKPMQGI